MKRLIFPLFYFLAIAIPFILTSFNVFSGGMAFWYDPARDMLSAWNNLSKLTLIGSTSGIPGIFYGPYWVWWLSFTEIFSKDPRFVLFLSTALPYLIVFPFVLYKASKLFDKVTSFLLWLLFSFTFQGYMTALWNPNLAPLLFLCVIYFLVNSYQYKGKKKYIKIFIAGILTGLAFNIHISFTSGFLIGTLVFLIFNPDNFPFNKKAKNIFKTLLSFISGFVIVFWPFVIFEFRHGFEQSKVFLNAISKQGDVVGIHGLSKPEIIMSFFQSFAKLLSVSQDVGATIFIFSVIVLTVLYLRKKINFSHLQVQLIFLLSGIVICVMGIYLSAKNPIWGYHFTGMEVVFLLFLGILISKIPPLKIILFIWVVILAYLQISGAVSGMFLSPLRIDTLIAKEYVVSQILTDAKNKPYTVFAYNTAIYMYDYSYLFRWMGKKDFSYDPGGIKNEGSVYLILPQNKKSVLDDFVHYKTPNDLYKTTKTWTIPNGTVILKRNPIQVRKI